MTELAAPPSLGLAPQGSGTSPGRKKGRKKGGKLAPLASMATVGGSGGGAGAGAPVAGGRPRKTFQKKDLVEAVRKMGNLSVSMASLELGKPSTSQGRKKGKLRRATDDSEIGSQMRVMESGVNTTSRRFNELKTLGDRKAVELQHGLDMLHMLKLENDALDKMKQRQTPESNRIGELMWQIEESSREIEEKLHYRRVLEHMYARLDVNQVRFDAHLNGMEEALRAARKEKMDVEVLARQLETGRTKALLDLQEAQRLVGAKRRDRRRVVAARDKQAETARKMEYWRERREAMRISMAQALRGDLTLEQEQDLIRLLAEKEQSTNQARSENEVRQRRVAAMEETFGRIRQATGVNTLEEMLAKFANQATNHAALEEEKREAEAKLSRAKAAREREEERFSYMKASGVGNTELNREISDKLNAQIQEARTEAKMKKAGHERLEATLVGIRQGALGLCQRLEPYYNLLDDEDSTLMARMKAEGQMDAEVERDTAEALGLSETLLSIIMEVASGAHETGASRFAPSGMGGLEQDDSSDMGSGNTMEDTSYGLSVDNMPSMRNNIRVQSTAQRITAEARALAADDGDADSEHGGGGGGGGGDGGETSTVGSDDEQAVEDMVPSRNFLKLCSSRQHTEMIRKMEIEERKKKLAERMEAADETEKATLTSKLARKRQQDQAMERISAPLPVVGLPPGVTQRDDVYAKTKAFLTQVPNLE